MQFAALNMLSSSMVHFFRVIKLKKSRIIHFIPKMIIGLVHPYGHFCSFQFCFFDHFACVKANYKKIGTGVYFYWNFTISQSFSYFFYLFFCIRYKK